MKTKANVFERTTCNEITFIKIIYNIVEEEKAKIKKVLAGLKMKEKSLLNREKRIIEQERAAKRKAEQARKNIIYSYFIAYGWIIVISS